MNRTIIALALLTLGANNPPSNNQQPSTEELLSFADKARGASSDGITWHIKVEGRQDGKNEESEYDVKGKEGQALAEKTKPTAGEFMLFQQHNLWFFSPTLRKPVSLSPRQRLLGQAANGDIAATDYYKDYQGSIVGEETVENIPCWKLTLKAKAKNVTYDGITYWVSKKDKLGIKADFLTVSGEVFKTAVFSYDNTVEIANKKLPFISKMVITDALNKQNVTTLMYQNPKLLAIPDTVFNINNLVR